MDGHVGQTHEVAALQDSKRRPETEPFPRNVSDRAKRPPLAQSAAFNAQIRRARIRFYTSNVHSASRLETAEAKLGVPKRYRRRKMDNQTGILICSPAHSP